MKIYNALFEDYSTVNILTYINIIFVVSCVMRLQFKCLYVLKFRGLLSVNKPKVMD